MDLLTILIWIVILLSGRVIWIQIGMIYHQKKRDEYEDEIIPTKPLDKFKVKARIGNVRYAEASRPFDDDFIHSEFEEDQ